ncbi:glycosyltransferase [Paraburkholderia sp. BL10I2N1]|uniref:glycosyltransferase n=1 Tax=Paraburkholderia sp. BL10I2N1 TaxID=1938796 RepID=UPI00105F1BD6|nr:glycosyltransferase [Paraburkholderia sp. BL10I2N1]
MRILHLLASLDPKAGGPAEGVRQGGVTLMEMGHEVEVVTLDDPGATFLQDFPLPVHALGPSRGNYRYCPRLVPWLQSHASQFDAVIVNGLWQYHSFGAWRALREVDVPYYVYPHGMLDPWFKRAYALKHLKKWLYWPWAEYRVLRDARAVLFTTEDERLLARQSFWLYRATEAVSTYGTSAPPQNDVELRESFLLEYPQLRGKRVILFLGRIHEKKGCDLLISAFANVAGLDGDAHLVIAGPDSAGWRSTLHEQAERLGVAQRITWTGMLQGPLKWGAFYASEAFVLPSHQENFGVAVAEALGCGVPALISNKVNIWREVDADGAGFVAADTVEGTEKNLRRWLTLDTECHAQMSARARDLFKARFTVDAMSRDLLRVLEGESFALAAGP